MEKIGKILVVEDDPDIGLMMKMMLMYKGYAVTLLENAVEIETTLQKNTFNLIFMDMLLSGLNGVDICATLKTNPSFSTIPIIMMSAHPDAEKLCLQAGANDFIAKPFDTAELLLKVSQMM